jgi:uncharacterized protein YkwD
MRCSPSTAVLLALAAGGAAGLLLIGSSQGAFAVKASPPTCEYGGKTCKTCEEFEADAQGGKRCTKCTLDLRCAVRRRFIEQSAAAQLSSDAQAILKAHNEYRAKHCVSALTWSAQLEADARAWANGCKFAHSTAAGENLAWGGPTQSAKEAVDLWYGEIKDYNFAAPKCCNPPDAPKVGHFTQMVWRNTAQLGCAMANCPPPSPDPDHYNGAWQYWVCRYSPPGNWNVNTPGELAKNVLPVCK